MRQGFIVEVLYQEHASWQGKVTWINENKVQSFRSALELLRLIDSTLDNDLHRDWKEASDRKTEL